MSQSDYHYSMALAHLVDARTLARGMTLGAKLDHVTEELSEYGRATLRDEATRASKLNTVQEYMAGEIELLRLCLLDKDPGGQHTCGPNIPAMIRPGMNRNLKVFFRQRMETLEHLQFTIEEAME